MDVVGGVRLADGSEAKIISGVDDHSRFCVSAHVVARATARPTCDALELALRRYGAPQQILTDNGKVFTNRFGAGDGIVLFDRICRDHDIRHLLTRPRSPTTTGKVERFHKTLRREFLDSKVFASIADAQAQLDVWVEHYNTMRPHQGIGMVAPIRRFELAAREPVDVPSESDVDVAEVVGASRRVSRQGRIGFASVSYPVAVWLAGQTVTVVCDGGLVQIYHRGVLVATHARRHDPAKQSAGMRRQSKAKLPEPKPTATVASVTRKVDSSGAVCFAGTNYRVGSAYKRRQVQVAVVGEFVEIAIGERLIRRHPIRHDRTREHGALANPGGRARRTNAA